MTKRKPGRVPSTAPKRTARLIVQVLPAEYDQVIAATKEAGYTNYSDYIRAALGLSAPRRPTAPAPPGEEPAE